MTIGKQTGAQRQQDSKWHTQGLLASKGHKQAGNSDYSQYVPVWINSAALGLVAIDTKKGY